MAAFDNPTSDRLAPYFGAVANLLLAAYFWYKFEQMSDHPSRILSRIDQWKGMWRDSHTFSSYVSITTEVMEDILRSPYFQIVLALVLFALAGARVLDVPVAIAIGLAWFVSVFGIWRSKWISKIQGHKRALLSIVVALALGLPAFWLTSPLTQRLRAIRPAMPDSQKAPQKQVPLGQAVSAPISQNPRTDSGTRFHDDHADLELWLVDASMLSVIVRNISKTVVARDPKYLVNYWNLDEARAFQSLPVFKRTDTGDFVRPGEFGFGPSGVFDLTGLSAPYTVGRVKRGDRLFGFATATCSNCEKLACYWTYYVYGVGGWYSVRPATSEQSCMGGYLAILDRVKQNPDNILSIVPKDSQLSIGTLPGHTEAATVSLHCHESGPILLQADTTTYVLETFRDVPKGFTEFSSSNQQLWPTTTIGGLFIQRCDLNSYETSPVFDLLLSFNLTFIEARKGKTETELVGDRELSSNDHILEIPVVEHSKPFTFYIHNSTEDFGRVREPEYATAEVGGRTGRISITLKQDSSDKRGVLMFPK
jgi:hypothetical protein